MSVGHEKYSKLTVWPAAGISRKWQVEITSGLAKPGTRTAYEVNSVSDGCLCPIILRLYDWSNNIV